MLPPSRHAQHASLQSAGTRSRFAPTQRAFWARRDRVSRRQVITANRDRPSLHKSQTEQTVCPPSTVPSRVTTRRHPRTTMYQLCNRPPGCPRNSMRGSIPKSAHPANRMVGPETPSAVTHFTDRDRRQPAIGHAPQGTSMSPPPCNPRRASGSQRKRSRSRLPRREALTPRRSARSRDHVRHRKRSQIVARRLSTATTQTNSKRTRSSSPNSSSSRRRTARSTNPTQGFWPLTGSASRATRGAGPQEDPHQPVPARRGPCTDAARPARPPSLAASPP